jgi:PKD repeat protein
MGGIDGDYTGPGTFVYSFTVPANTNFTVVVNGMASHYYCSDYSITVAGLLCPLDGGGACAGVSANFSGTPTNGVAPLSVTFTDTSTGSITNHFWNFGDGGTTNVATNTVVYTYNTAGVYTVTEIVTGPGGSSTNTQPSYITVSAPPPVAGFTATPTNGIAPLAVAFSDTSTGVITSWFWNFGDGGTTNVATNGVLYAYSTAGVYTVTEIVTGPGGSSTNTRPNYIVVLTPFQGWQIQYFGSTNNPNAAPAADGDGTGQDNLFKFIAGLDPTNPAAIFQLTIVTDTNQPNAQDLQFLPVAGGRTYMPQFNTDLVNGVWFPLTTFAGPVTNGNQISVTDTNPLSPQEFYRISISMP